MDFIDWAMEFPARIVDEIPDRYFGGPETSYYMAELLRDKAEVDREAACETVKHGDFYYVIPKD